MILELLKGAICLTGVGALIFAIIVLATGIAPMGEYFPILARISAGLFLFVVVIVANILNGKFVPGMAKIFGFVIVNAAGLLMYTTI